MSGVNSNRIQDDRLGAIENQLGQIQRTLGRIEGRMEARASHEGRLTRLEASRARVSGVATGAAAFGSALAMVVGWVVGFFR